MLSDTPPTPRSRPGLARARRFYEDVLGLAIEHETPTTIYYSAGGGTLFALSRSAGKSSGSHTQMAFRVSDIEREVAALREAGVAFEEYETPKTVDGIADMGAGRAAWLRDLDGNLLGIFQFKPASLLVADREGREEVEAGPRIAIALGSITASTSTRSSMPRTARSAVVPGSTGRSTGRPARAWRRRPARSRPVRPARRGSPAATA